MPIVIVRPELPPREENKLEYADILALAIRETLDDEKFHARHSLHEMEEDNDTFFERTIEKFLIIADVYYPPNEVKKWLADNIYCDTKKKKPKPKTTPEESLAARFANELALADFHDKVSLPVRQHSCEILFLYIMPEDDQGLNCIIPKTVFVRNLETDARKILQPEEVWTPKILEEMSESKFRRIKREPFLRSAIKRYMEIHEKVLKLTLTPEVVRPFSVGLLKNYYDTLVDITAGSTLLTLYTPLFGDILALL